MTFNHFTFIPALLSLWCEDLGRLLLLRHQKTRGSPGVGGDLKAPSPDPGDLSSDPGAEVTMQMQQTMQQTMGPKPMCGPG